MERDQLDAKRGCETLMSTVGGRKEGLVFSASTQPFTAPQGKMSSKLVHHVVGLVATVPGAQLVGSMKEGLSMFCCSQEP
jgi:hypothetical protein